MNGPTVDFSCLLTQRRNFRGKVILFLFNAFTELIAGKGRKRHFGTDLFTERLNNFGNLLIRIDDISLLEETDFT